MCYCVVFFFFQQKTAYEIRISDWSSDVCSSNSSTSAATPSACRAICTTPRPSASPGSCARSSRSGIRDAWPPADSGPDDRAPCAYRRCKRSEAPAPSDAAPHMSAPLMPARLCPARRVLSVGRGEQGRGVDAGPVAQIVPAAELVADLGFGGALRDLRALPCGGGRQAGGQKTEDASGPAIQGAGGGVGEAAPEADHLCIVGRLRSEEHTSELQSL